jgi:streptomycin 3"-adenylyltransferase
MTDAAGAPLTADPREYAGWLAAELAALLGPALVGAYLHGSAVLGGWTPERSDVDLLFVVADNIPSATLTAAGDLLIAAAPGCPGRGLECSMVTTSRARRPGLPWPFLLHVGIRDGDPVLHIGSGVPGDADLLMHYAVCRAAGIAMAGPPPADLIGAPGRPAILSYLAGELDWGLAHAPECYAVLNACRALVYLHDDAIVSKVAGGLAALDRGLAPAGLVQRALDQQQARVPERPPAPDAVSFVRDVAIALSDAAAGRTGSPPA